MLGADFTFAYWVSNSLRGIILAGLGISTDEIAIGFPLGALSLSIVLVLGVIAIQTFFVSAGRRIGQRLGLPTNRDFSVW